MTVEARWQAVAQDPVEIPETSRGQSHTDIPVVSCSRWHLSCNHTRSYPERYQDVQYAGCADTLCTTIKSCQSCTNFNRVEEGVLTSRIRSRNLKAVPSDQLQGPRLRKSLRKGITIRSPCTSSIISHGTRYLEDAGLRRSRLKIASSFQPGRGILTNHRGVVLYETYKWPFGVIKHLKGDFRHRILTGLIRSESCIPLRSSAGWFCNLFGTLNGSSGSRGGSVVCSSDMSSQA